MSRSAGGNVWNVYIAYSDRRLKANYRIISVAQKDEQYRLNPEQYLESRLFPGHETTRLILRSFVRK